MLRLFFGYASILPSSRLVTLDSAQIGKAGHTAQLSGLTVDGTGKRGRRRNFPDVERFLNIYFLLKKTPVKVLKTNLDVHSPLFQIAWILILSEISTRLFIRKQYSRTFIRDLLYCTRRILLNVYVALIDVVSLVVNVLITKAKCKYVNLLTAAKLKRFYLLIC